MKTLEELRNEYSFMKYFSDISMIPRASGQEEEISNMLVAFAKTFGYESMQDDIKNVIIRKPASMGYENKPSIMLQGHLDMVCEKEDSSDHNFFSDPIQIKLKDDMIYADKTSLGADNGLGIAYCMAIMADVELKHPELEFVFTVEEETTMKGAELLDSDLLRSRYIINLDSEEEGILCISNAGGISVCHTIEITRATNVKDLKCIDIRISGLNGGHSGDDIVYGGGNANKIMGRLLNELSNKGSEFELVDLFGGLQDNAIAKVAYASIMIDCMEIEKITESLYYFEKMIKEEFISTDPNLKIELGPSKNNDKCNAYFDSITKKKVINLLLSIPNGVQSMETNLIDLPRTSTNLGLLEIRGDQIVFNSLLRSSNKEELNKLVKKMESISDAIGCSIDTFAYFPSWPYRENSKISELINNIYKNIYEQDIDFHAVHGGLECGFLIEKIPNADMVSLGPNIYGVHTSNEHFDVSSAVRVWDLLVEILEGSIQLN